MDDENIVFARYGVLDGLEEHGAFPDVVSVGGAALFDVLPVYGPFPVLDEVGEGPALGVEAVAQDLVFAADSGIQGSFHYSSPLVFSGPVILAGPDQQERDIRQRSMI